MADKTKAKLRILQLIRDEREILFGAFSSKLTKIHKMDAWERILEEAKNLGLISTSKTASYIRDIFWQNLRKRTMKKIDDAQQTGGPGGEGCILDDIDQMVLDIIGKNILKNHTCLLLFFIDIRRSLYDKSISLTSGICSTIFHGKKDN